jgi:hypothetical protein
MNRKSGGQTGIGDRRAGVGPTRGRVESDNDDMDESGLSDDEDEQVGGFTSFQTPFKLSQNCVFCLKLEG